MLGDVLGGTPQNTDEGHRNSCGSDLLGFGLFFSGVRCIFGVPCGPPQEESNHNLPPGLAMRVFSMSIERCYRFRAVHRFPPAVTAVPQNGARSEATGSTSGASAASRRQRSTKGFTSASAGAMPREIQIQHLPEPIKFTAGAFPEGRKGMKWNVT